MMFEYREATRITLHDLGIAIGTIAIGTKLYSDSCPVFDNNKEYVPFSAADGETITSVKARIMGSHLLGILITTASETETFTDEFTYCGGFSVEWATRSAVRTVSTDNSKLSE